MPINKNACVRYMALDRCLGNRTKRYYMDDLVEECRKALAYVNGDFGAKGAEGVSRRQIFNDLNDMEMMFGVFVERLSDGHKKYYTYENGTKNVFFRNYAERLHACI